MSNARVRLLHPDRNEVLDTARDYLKSGWQPVPIPSGKKFPTFEGWQKLKIPEEDLRYHFADAQQNIGVRFGADSGGLTDVDLDCQEAIELADDFLPTTDAEFGRRSKRRAHRLYVTDLYESEMKAAAQGAAGVWWQNAH